MFHIDNRYTGIIIHNSLYPKSPGTSKSEVLAERTLKGPIAEKLYVNVEFLRPNVGIFLIIMDHEV